MRLSVKAVKFFFLIFINEIVSNKISGGPVSKDQDICRKTPITFSPTFILISISFLCVIICLFTVTLLY